MFGKMEKDNNDKNMTFLLKKNVYNVKKTTIIAFCFVQCYNADRLIERGAFGERIFSFGGGIPL